jgi:hypothetical protein
MFSIRARIANCSDAGNQPGGASMVGRAGGCGRRPVAASNPAGTSLDAALGGVSSRPREESRSSLSTLSARTETARDGAGGESSRPDDRTTLAAVVNLDAREAPMTGEQTGERQENYLQITHFRAVSKTVSGGFVRRGFKSLPLRFSSSAMSIPSVGGAGLRPAGAEATFETTQTRRGLTGETRFPPCPASPNGVVVD